MGPERDYLVLLKKVQLTFERDYTVHPGKDRSSDLWTWQLCASWKDRSSDLNVTIFCTPKDRRPIIQTSERNSFVHPDKARSSDLWTGLTSALSGKDRWLKVHTFERDSFARPETM